MHIVAVTIVIKPQHLEAFKAATLDNATNTRKEPGNLRFDVLQSDEDPTRFLLYEAYKSKDDVAAHQKTDHYLRWKSTVADLMAQPRQRTTHNALFFDNSPQ